MIADLFFKNEDKLTPAEKLELINSFRREFHASNILKGLLAGRRPDMEDKDADGYVIQAVNTADALIAQLDERSANVTDPLA